MAQQLPQPWLDLPQPGQTQDVLNNTSQAWPVGTAQQNLALSETLCPASLLSNVLHLPQESEILSPGAGSVGITDNARPNSPTGSTALHKYFPELDLKQ